MTLICTVVPSFLISESIRRIGASRVAILGSIGPVATIILAAVFLGERLNGFQWIGAIIIISGVMLVNRENTNNSPVIAPNPRRALGK